MPGLKETIREFLRDSGGVDVTEVADDSPLFSTGIIDSFTLVSLMALIETHAGFQVDPMDVTLENFDTIERMQAYVDRRRETE